MTEVKPATDEIVNCAASDWDVWARESTRIAIIARIEADRAEIANLKGALSRLNEIQGSDDLLAQVHGIASAALERWQELWKDENALALRQTEELAEKADEIVRLKAEVERLTPMCRRCGGGRTTTWTGNTPCPECNGTGRAR